MTDKHNKLASRTAAPGGMSIEYDIVLIVMVTLRYHLAEFVSSLFIKKSFTTFQTFIFMVRSTITERSC